MISSTHMAEVYDRNVQIIKLQTDGLSHPDSLVQLPFRANCMNWVVGHLITNRFNVLKLLGADLPASAAEVERYTRESEPITSEGTGVLPLGTLIERLEQAQALIAGRLAEITPQELEQQAAFFGRRSMTVGEWLLFFFFHDSYHTGQAEILRQAAGKDDKII
jgi:hypothetical protein